MMSLFFCVCMLKDNQDIDLKKNVSNRIIGNLLEHTTALHGLLSFSSQRFKTVIKLTAKLG